MRVQSNDPSHLGASVLKLAGEHKVLLTVPKKLKTFIWFPPEDIKFVKYIDPRAYNCQISITSKFAIMTRLYPTTSLMGVNQISQGIAVAKFGQKDLMTNIWSSTVEAWLVFIIIDFVFVGTRNLKLGLVFNIYSVETGNIVTVLPIGIDKSEVYEHVQWDVQDPWAVITMQLKNETCKKIGINAREMSLKQFNDSHLNHYFVRLNGNVAIF